MSAAAAGHVRRARRRDAAAVAAVHVQSWRESYGAIMGPGAARPEAGLRRLALWRRVLARPRPREGVFAALAGGRVVGFGMVGPQREPDRAADAEVWSLYLLRAAQGRGLGRRLMAAMAEDAAGWGARSLELWVLTRNRPAWTFYRALGGRPADPRWFTRHGRRLHEHAMAWDDLARLRR